MTDEQIKVLEAMRDDLSQSRDNAITEAFERVSSEDRNKLLTWSDKQQPKIEALTAALSYIEDMREIEAKTGRLRLNGNGIEDLGVIERDWDRDSNFWLVEGPSWQGPASVDSKARFNNLREAFKAIKGGKD